MTDAVRGQRGRPRDASDESGGADTGRRLASEASSPRGATTGTEARTKREPTPLPDPVPPVCEGQVVSGKYLVEEFIGMGGMGVVVAATHLQLEQRVALKFLYRGGEANEETVERFIREARAAAKIQSEHVGRVIDVGALPSGEPFMVMEHLEGRDLSAVLLTEGALPVARAVEYVLQACEAIAEAHAFGIVHRDLKPANLFLARRIDGSQLIKVLDFGISKLMAVEGSIENTDPALTNPSAVMGSPLYMSPEQMHASMHVDARTDIWALGVILYELLTTRTPFEAATIPLIHAAVLHDPPRPLTEELPSAPDGLEAVLTRCLEKDPTKRFADIAEFVTTLAPFSPRQGRVTTKKVARLFAATRVSDRPPPSLRGLQPAFTGEPTSTITSWGEEQKRSEPPASSVSTAVPTRGRARFRIAIVGAVLLAGAGGGFVVKRRLTAASAARQAANAAAAAPTAAPEPTAASAGAREPGTSALSPAASRASENAPAPSSSGAAALAAPSSSASAHHSATKPPAARAATSAPEAKPTATTPGGTSTAPVPKPTGTTGFGDRE